MSILKRCTSCGEEKPVTEFHVASSRRGGRRSHCKECVSFYSKSYREQDPLKFKEANKKWADANPEKIKEYIKRSNDKRQVWRRNYRMNKRYGLSLIDYNAMVESQRGLCAANGCLETVYGGRLSVDHDHSTGKVRGLLCHGCNSALGRVDDSIEKLKGLIAYLERSNS